MCADPVVVTFRRVVESFTAVWAFMWLFSGAVGEMREPRIRMSIACQRIRPSRTYWRVSCVSSVPLLAKPFLQNLHVLFLESETRLGVRARSRARLGEVEELT